MSAVGKWCEYQKYAYVARCISDACCVLMVVLHMLLQYWKKFSMFENAMVYLCMFAGVVAAGSALGMVVRKILKWDEVKNVQHN